jgi:hypothetical protein
MVHFKTRRRHIDKRINKGLWIAQITFLKYNTVLSFVHAKLY